MTLAHFYHAYAAGSWHEPIGEHMRALADSGYDGPIYLGIVGPADQREQVRNAIPDGIVVAEAEHGFEDVTLNAVRSYAIEHDGAVMYAHTKGAHDTSDFRAQWRRSMTRHVVSGWNSNLRALEEHQLVGCHWLTHEQFSGLIGGPFFGGNFWLARCDYLRTLEVCPGEDRFDAEGWIGRDHSPRALDLLPGWPAEHLFSA